MNKPFPWPRAARIQTPRAEFLDVHNEAQLARCGRDKGGVAAKLASATSAFGKRALIAERQLFKILAKNRTVRNRPICSRSASLHLRPALAKEAIMH